MAGKPVAMGHGMLKILDRCRRDSTLFQFTARRLQDFIDPDHLLVRIDEQIDSARLAAPLEDHYCPGNDRPAIHPEVMARALLICSLYNISSFRRLSSAIAENNAHRWFCSLAIDDPVFDHSTSSCFIERIGRDGSAGIFNGLTEEMLRLGLFSPAYPPQERGPIIRVGLARVAEQPDPQGRGWTVCALEDAPEHPAGPADMGTDTATSTPGGQRPRGAGAGRGRTTGRRTRQSEPRLQVRFSPAGVSDGRGPGRLRAKTGPR